MEMVDRLGVVLYGLRAVLADKRLVSALLLVFGISYALIYTCDNLCVDSARDFFFLFAVRLSE